MFGWNRRCISLAKSISRPAELPTHRPVAALRSRTAAIAIGLVVVLAAGLVVSRSSVFRVRRIEVTGLDHLRRADVIRWSGLSHATNALWLDEEDVAARLQQDPWIASAVVTTSFPATVHIAVLERSPIAETRTPGGTMLVAGDGTLLGPADGSDRTLPAIVVPTVSDGRRRVPLEGPARAASALVDADLAGLRSVVVASDGTLSARLEGGIVARLGRATELGAKADALAEILAWSRAGGPPLRTIDVSAPSAPAVTPSS